MEVHPVIFHISILKKFLGDPLLIVPTEYEEILVQILGRQFRKLRIKEVALVKVF